MEALAGIARGWARTGLAFLGAAVLGCGGGSSDGLATASCTAKGGSPGRSENEIVSGGRTRRFRLSVPPSYRPAQAAPVVFDFHGFASDGAEQEGRSEMTQVGEANGFLVVTPDGFEKGWNAEVCCGETVGAGIDDVRFVRDVVASLEADYCIDRRRIYAAGYSNGGLFSIFLACRADDLIAAAASVAAASLDRERCQPARPVPVLFLNGTGDPVVPYSVAPPSVELWREIDGCADASAVTYDRGDSSCETWSDCAAGSEVGFCTIEGGGHTWPGGGDFPSFLGNKSEDLEASAAIWEFFRSHPLPES